MQSYGARIVRKDNGDIVLPDEEARDKRYKKIERLRKIEDQQKAIEAENVRLSLRWALEQTDYPVNGGDSSCDHIFQENYMQFRDASKRLTCIHCNGGIVIPFGNLSILKQVI